MATETRWAYELRVEPAAGRRWVVCYEHRQRPLSEHSTANEAEGGRGAPRACRGVTRVLLHDCYGRVHEVALFAPGRRPSRAR
jgi:hypothetical protein